ncbi:MAG: Gfo/Idh/MocA family oxidoreductase [Phycisphaerales bacterium]|nr:MAG: Gfo/Idh/MocA family oxidoreductase [Phycisphaerales bacterium]
MNTNSKNDNGDSVTRRDFMKTSAIAAAGSLAAAELAVSRSAHAAGSDEIRVGLIGCGGRGTGAAAQCMQASPRVRIAAMADVFRDRVDGSREALEKRDERAKFDDSRCFVGFDGYKELIADGVDAVILATPPHFRPFHLEEAVKAGCHVFMEKPVAVDPVGIRKVIAAGEMADRKGLSIVAGTQRRHEARYQELIYRIHAGAIGDIVAARCYWNQGGLWVNEPRKEWSDMEWQLRNWLYFTWLSGDHIVEQHVHNIDVVNWAIGDHPIRAMGLGGRQVRTDPIYGHIFDHFAVEFEYPNNVFVLSTCRQIDGCANRVHEVVHGTIGSATTQHETVIRGANSWRFEADNPNPYVQEHKDLIASIEGGTHYNEARQVAESTLCAIMGRMSTYTGQEVTWEQAMNSELDLTPPTYEFGDLPLPPVAMPGQTKLI